MASNLIITCLPVTEHRSACSCEDRIIVSEAGYSKNAPDAHSVQILGNSGVLARHCGLLELFSSSGRTAVTGALHALRLRS